MKKSVFKKMLGITLVLTMVLQCLCGMSITAFADVTLTGTGTVNSPYQIGTYEQLIAFRSIVNNGTNAGAYATLTADIDVSAEAWTTIGTYSNASTDVAYSGTFDGAGHKITGLSVTGDNMGFFGYTNGATIKSLTIEGNAHGGNTGGFVGAGIGTTITSCKFIGNVTGFSGVAGFIGNTGLAAAATSKNTITNCAFIGNVGNSSTQGNASGFAYTNTTVKNSYIVGDVTGGAEVAGVGLWAVVENCFAYGSITAVKTTASTFGLSNSDSNVNAYYVTGKTSGGGGYSTSATEEEFASGKVALALGSAFGQKLGTDLYPVFATSDNAVVKTAINTYTNDSTENGTTVPYSIKNYADLAAFRDAVNARTTATSANVVMTNDIAIPEGTVWTPIGTWTWVAASFDTTKDAVYSGTFDGAGYTISNLNVSGLDPAWYGGFFRQTNGAIIKNLTLKGNVNIGEAYAGGFVGVANGTTITNCKFIGNVSVGNTAAGFIGTSIGFKLLDGFTTVKNIVTNCAFIGNVTSTPSGSASGVSHSNVVVENTYVVGDITGPGEVAGIGLWADVKNCFAYGKLTATNNVNATYGLSNGNNNQNAYYVSGWSSGGGTGVGCTAATVDEFASGKVAYALGTAFGQKLGEDLYPVFKSENNEVIKTTVNTYTNDKTENGTDVPYTIKSYDDLAGFRDAVNASVTLGTTAASANVVMTKDIAIPEGTVWTPIGTWTWAKNPYTADEAVYSGTFNGGGYTISNVDVSGTDMSRYVGFFRQLSGATIKNLTIIGNVIGTEAYAGGFAGIAKNTTVDNCNFKGNVTAANTASGFFGTTVTGETNNVSNCSFTGNITSTPNGVASGVSRADVVVKNTYVAGDVKGVGEVAGIGLAATAENCFVYGNIIATTYNSFKISNNPVTNCYYLNCTADAGTVAGYGEQISADDFTGGKLAYMMNKNAGDIIYGQTIGTDSYPVFITDTNMVYQSGDAYSNTEGAFAMIDADEVLAVSAGQAQVIVAQYKTDGGVNELVSAKVVPLEAKTIYNPEIINEDNATIYKVFVWTNMEDMSPVCSGDIYEVE